MVLEHVIPHTKATLLWCSPHRNHSSYLPVSASLAKAIFLIFVLPRMWLWGYQETCGCLCLGTLLLASTLHEQSVHGLLADFTGLHLWDWLCACSQASQAVSLGHRFQQGCTWMDSMHSIAICPTFFFKKSWFFTWYGTTAFELLSHAALPFLGKSLKKGRKAHYRNTNCEAFTCPSACIHKWNPSPCSSLEREVDGQHFCSLLGGSTVSTNAKCGMLEEASKSKVLAWTCIT